MPGRQNCDGSSGGNACLAIGCIALPVVGAPAAITFAYDSGGPIAAKITAAACGAIYATVGATMCWSQRQQNNQRVTNQDPGAPATSDMTRNSNQAPLLHG